MSLQIVSLHSHLESLIYISKTAPLDPCLPAAWSLAKVQAGRTLEFCVREAQRIVGGAGDLSGGGEGERIERISRDVRVLVVGGGSEEILIDLAVRMGMKKVEGKAKL
jgi:alkylation response protein AidB-like acyl-CoA dehydrogenase